MSELRRRKPSNGDANGATTTSHDTKKDTQKNDNESIPSILRAWVSIFNLVSRSVPSVRIFGLDFTFAVASALFLTTYRGIAYLAMVYILGWPYGHLKTVEAVSSVVGMTHSILLLTPLFLALISQPYRPSCKLTDHPQWYQSVVNTLLQFTTGYMIQDMLLTYFVCQRNETNVLTKSDYLIVGHHLATTAYMTSCRVVGAGHLGAMILMYTGEFTNPIQNLEMVSRYGNELGNLGLSSYYHELLKVVFAAIYVVFRSLIGPVCALHLTYDIGFTKAGRENVPRGVFLFWSAASWGVLIGSIPWIIETAGQVWEYFE